MMTVSAAVRLIPKPPALVDSRNTGMLFLLFPLVLLLMQNEVDEDEEEDV